MLEVNKLCMAFAGRPILHELSFSLSRGSVTGFLGPNGAGKTTTMRLLSGYFRPTAGTINVAGYDVSRQPRQAQACIGYLPEAPGGFSQLTAAEFLHFCGQARALSTSAIQSAIERMCDTLTLGPALTTPLHQLSKGWRQRVWLAQALLHDPPLLILDEPTDGLDPSQKRHTLTLLRQCAENKALLFSTHNLEEAASTCDRIIIIANGRILADAPSAAIEDLSETFFRLTTESP